MFTMLIIGVILYLATVVMIGYQISIAPIVDEQEIEKDQKR